MPLMRYFVFVGGALLALLFAANAWLPPLPVTKEANSTASADLSSIRIRSDRKWPERVVFDTSQPTPAPVVIAQNTIAPPKAVPATVPAPVVAEAASRPAGVARAPLKTVGVREAYAQLPDAVRPEPKRKR